jgi:DedD protein
MNMPQKQTDATIDGQLDLKKRSRRRLVGAAALALLAVIVLPMVMDREPRQPAQDVQVKIPSQDVGLAVRALPARPATPMPASAAETNAPPAPPEPAKQAVEPAVDKPVARSVDKGVEKPAEKPVVKPIEKSPDKPADKPTTNKADDAKALAALNGGDALADQWVVQLGAYKEAGNVKVLLAKLKQMGVPAFTENFDTPQGARTRVRAGPFKSREAAEKAKVKIHVIGVDGPVAPK